MTTQNFDTALENYLTELTAKHLENDKANWPTLLERTGQYHYFFVQKGPKFAKIVRSNEPDGSCGSVHCFVEIENGNIWKAASFKAPQKNGVRGNLYNEKKPLLSGQFYSVSK